MKIACIIYHKNALSLYKREWIDKCINSIKMQSVSDFTVFEHNYGGGKDKFAEGIRPDYYFANEKFTNHIGSLNYLHAIAFSQGYDIVFNTNIDDFYSPDRFEKQLERINEGFDIVSSNFYYITEIGEDDVITNGMDMFGCGDIRKNLNRNHNVISHPCVAMHRRVWDGGMRYNDLLGYEDLDLWQRAADYKFSILQDYLLYYRIHENQITKTEYIK